MNKLLILKDKNNFSYIRYFIFTHLKKYSVYNKYKKGNILFLPFKKEIKKSYKKALVEYLKRLNTEVFLAFDEEINKELKIHFSTINIKNIYHTNFIKILNFLSKNKLYEYEIVFISDNIKEINILLEKCIKKVKAVSVLTEKKYLYESINDCILSRYGTVLNIKNPNEKLKKHNKIYINCGNKRVFNKDFFKNVNMLDIYGIYEGAYKNIIFEAGKKEKEFLKEINMPYLLQIKEFMYPDEDNKNIKIVNIKK